MSRSRFVDQAARVLAHENPTHYRGHLIVPIGIHGYSIQVEGTHIGYAKSVADGKRTIDQVLGPAKRNPSSSPAHARAQRAVRTFFGRAPVGVQVPLEALNVPPLDPRRPLVALGELMEVHYAADRGDGKTVYRHPFNAKSRPLLARSHDGRALYIVGGRYRVTDSRGIVDKARSRRR